MLIPRLKKSISAMTIGLSVCALPSVAQATHAWGSYHWARATPQVTLVLGDNLTTAEWKAMLANSSSDWNSPGLVGATFTPVLTAIVAGQGKRNCSMLIGTTQVCNAKYGSNGWLGLASINISGVHITQGSAKMNDTYFDTATYNNPNEKRHVMCQEVAHTFGLAHQSENGSSQNSCMDYFSNTGVNATNTASTRPNLHDFDQLNIIYTHIDSTTTVAATTITAAVGVDITHDSASWGQLMSQSKNGRSSTYERHNADGSTTLTHVYWTDEAAAECPSCDHRSYPHTF